VQDNGRAHAYLWTCCSTVLQPTKLVVSNSRAPGQVATASSSKRPSTAWCTRRGYGHDPRLYLKDVLERLLTHPASPRAPAPQLASAALNSHCPSRRERRPLTAVRHHVRIGERLPLDKGAPGKVILAFMGEKGQVDEQIRQRGYDISMGEREPEVSSVAAPVFGLSWRLLGSMCISGPTSRLSQKKLEAHAKTVIAAANALSYELAGSVTGETPGVVSTWHP
jgi:hypothetical protein